MQFRNEAEFVAYHMDLRETLAAYFRHHPNDPNHRGHVFPAHNPNGYRLTLHLAYRQYIREARRTVEA